MGPCPTAKTRVVDLRQRNAPRATYLTATTSARIERIEPAEFVAKSPKGNGLEAISDDAQKAETDQERSIYPTTAPGFIPERDPVFSRKEEDDEAP